MFETIHEQSSEKVMIEVFAHYVRKILRDVGLVGAKSTAETIGFEKIPRGQSFVTLNQ